MRRRTNWARNGRYRPLSRILKVLVALMRTRFGMTLEDLITEVDCSRRTLYRYLEVLEEAGVSIEVEHRMTGQTAFRIDPMKLRGACSVLRSMEVSK